jgi:Zn finger protein HypA/HybF involved in hydrogenase expression
MNYKNNKKLMADIIYFCKSSMTMAEALRKINEKYNIRMKFETFKKYAEEFNVYKPNKPGVGITRKSSYKNTLEEIFIMKKETSTSLLKDRLIKEGYKKCICEECKLTKWNGLDIPLELHHKDGDKTNNELSNLAILCPNCHSQTDNFRAKNIKRKQTEKKSKIQNRKEICPICNKNMKTKKYQMCLECRKKKRVDDSSMGSISKDELKNLIRNKSFCEIGKIYGITDNAVRRYCKKYGLPYKKEDIKKYSDDDWKKL